jgi:hypothetical protein
VFKGFTIVAVTDSANEAYGIIMYHAAVSAGKQQGAALPSAITAMTRQITPIEKLSTTHYA